MVERLDEIDGDENLEPTGDEQDGTFAEDEAGRPWHDHGAGDPSDAEDDDPDRCLAGDDWIGSGPAIVADCHGFTSRPSLYCVGMDEDCERDSDTRPTMGAQWELGA